MVGMEGYRRFLPLRPDLYCLWLDDAGFPAQAAAGAFGGIDTGSGSVPDQCARYRAGSGTGAALGTVIRQTGRCIDVNASQTR